MKRLVIGSLALGLLASAISLTSPAHAQDTKNVLRILKGQPAKDPKSLGTEVSTVTTYSAESPTGIVRNCSARCANGTQLTWQCPLDPKAIAVHCLPRCSPPPAQGDCIYE